MIRRAFLAGLAALTALAERRSAASPAPEPPPAPRCQIHGCDEDADAECAGCGERLCHEHIAHRGTWYGGEVVDLCFECCVADVEPIGW